MKLKCVATAAAIVMAAGATNANANLLFDPYVGATAGVGGATLFIDHDTTTDVAQSYGAVLGLDIPLVRVEAEYNYLLHKDAKAHIVMGNAYLKMPTLLVAPYIGAGVGAIVDGSVDNGPDMNKTAAYQGMLGLTFDIPVLPFKIDAEARALYAHNVFSVADDDANILHYDIRAKLRYIF